MSSSMLHNPLPPCVNSSLPLEREPATFFPNGLENKLHSVLDKFESKIADDVSFKKIKHASDFDKQNRLINAKNIWSLPKIGTTLPPQQERPPKPWNPYVVLDRDLVDVMTAVIDHVVIHDESISPAAKSALRECVQALQYATKDATEFFDRIHADPSRPQMIAVGWRNAGSMNGGHQVGIVYAGSQRPNVIYLCNRGQDRKLYSVDQTIRAYCVDDFSLFQTKTIAAYAMNETSDAESTECMRNLFRHPERYGLRALSADEHPVPQRSFQRFPNCYVASYEAMICAMLYGLGLSTDEANITYKRFKFPLRLKAFDDAKNLKDKDLIERIVKEKLCIDNVIKEKYQSNPEIQQRLAQFNARVKARKLPSLCSEPLQTVSGH